MSNYEDKLGKWLKYVQQQVEAASHLGKMPEAEETATPETEAEEPIVRPESIVVRDRLGRAAPPDGDGFEPEEVVADSSLIDDDYRPTASGPAVFDETDVPDVEDYLPFLKEERTPEPPPESERIVDQGNLFVSEGTGVPRPVVREAETEGEAQEAPRPQARMLPAREEFAPPPAATDPAGAVELWDRLPRHIQLLVGQPPKEVAQRSYKRFKETRDELIARLLDPTISLEEAARILNVCPTTVRRYTNRGLLRHFRTAGNQRRFRLSDVLAFLESVTGSREQGQGVG